MASSKFISYSQAIWFFCVTLMMNNTFSRQTMALHISLVLCLTSAGYGDSWNITHNNERHSGHLGTAPAPGCRQLHFLT